KYADPTPYLKEARRDLRREVSGLRERPEARGEAPSEARRAAEPGGPGPDFAGGQSSGAEPPFPEDACVAADDSSTAFVRLLAATPDPDRVLVETLLWAGGAGSMEHCRALASKLDEGARRALVLSHLQRLGPHDSVLREYEFIDLSFELVVSASCYAQLK